MEYVYENKHQIPLMQQRGGLFHAVSHTRCIFPLVSILVISSMDFVNISSVKFQLHGKRPPSSNCSIYSSV